MPQKAEAGDVGAGVDGEVRQDFGTCLVEREHGFHGFGEVGFGEVTGLEGVGDQPGAQFLGEDEAVAGLGTGVGVDAVGVDEAGDGEAVLEFWVLHGVAADERAAGFGRLGLTAEENLVEDLRIEFVGGKTRDVERGERLAAHGVHVAERVGRGNGSKGVGIVDDGGEEIDGLHEGLALVEAIDAGVVGEVEADEQVGISVCWQTCQGAPQLVGAQLGSSAAAGDHLRQALGLFIREYLLPTIHKRLGKIALYSTASEATKRSVR